MKALFHIHTHHSCDSILTAKEITDYCLSNQIDCLFITDHGTVRGAMEVRAHVEKYGLPIHVITGAEFGTDIGDIIGIFIHEDIHEHDHRKVISEIKKQGGLFVLPHPYKQHDLFRIHYLEAIDFIEVFNPRIPEKLDEFSHALADYYRSFKVAGTDAHCKRDLDTCYLHFENLEEFKKGNVNIVTHRRCRLSAIYLTQIIKGFKTKNAILLLRSLLVFIIFKIIGK